MGSRRRIRGCLCLRSRREVLPRRTRDGIFLAELVCEGLQFETRRGLAFLGDAGQIVVNAGLGSLSPVSLEAQADLIDAAGDIGVHPVGVVTGRWLIVCRCLARLTSTASRTDGPAGVKQRRPTF